MAPDYTEFLKNLRHSLLADHIAASLPGSFEVLMQEIKKKIESKIINIYSGHNIAFPSVKDELSKDLDRNIHLWNSFVFCAYAEIAKESSLHTEAWEMIANSYYWQGQHHGSQHSRTPAKGGAARAAKFDKVRDEVKLLLKSHAPKDGWKSAAEAAKTISEEVSSFISNNEFPQSKFNIKNLIAQWCGQNRDNDIHQIFYESCSEECRRKIDRKKNQLC